MTSTAPGSVAVALGPLRLHELREDAARRVRMDEGDEVPAQAAPGALVDELGARGAKLVKGGVEVADGVADVMKARATPLEEARDRALRIDRLDQLQPVGADVERDRLDALVLHALADPDPHAVALGELRQGRVDVLHRVGDVMDPLEHHAATLPTPAWARRGAGPRVRGWSASRPGCRSGRRP